MDESAPVSANGLGYRSMKTLAVRMNESTRAQLGIAAELDDRTVTDKIRLAREAWIEKTTSDSLRRGPRRWSPRGTPGHTWPPRPRDGGIHCP
ncbi:hypothetical protein [Microbacterium sp. No. 7]|uniref:hypothetical protein n=1 Tax=Microbacterium sp. No. 7 TaxID=1714373 RepID=UPI0012E2F96C|nr:hypothetical protein [Microbacterium sp. No. 7]